ncbi:MAG TPA: hypothetical protein VFP91_14540 [Vicinamibacterales bacterium]|nr:hypothetical protein [Vicinamibacterales bacterium]
MPLRRAALALLLLVAPFFARDAATQTRPRTPWGDPDLQGVWPGGPVFAVPFERDPEFGTRATLSAEEAATRNAEVDAQSSFVTGNFFPELGHAPALTSLISDPENGRLPPMTDDGARRAAAWRVIADPEYAAFGPEELRPYDRCITRGVLGSAFPNSYSSGMDIFQSPGFVVIRYEMIHEARIIPLDRRPHVSSAIRLYLGDSRGWWEGDTLVVETTNFNGLTGSYARNGDGNPTSTSLRLVERFRLQDAKTLSYQVRVEDPQTWVRPWTVTFPLTRDDKYVIYEYACHEGNYAIQNILSAARAKEK